MKKFTGKIYYEINSEKCNRNRGAVSEALGIQKFIEKLSKEKGYACVGIIRICSGFWDPAVVTISEKNKIITSQNIVEQLGKRNNYGIKMLVLVDDLNGFEKEMENYLHTREEYTASQRKWVTNYESEQLVEEMMNWSYCEQTFALDCYDDSLNGYASSFVNKIEDCNFNRCEYRIFRRYDYGMEGLEKSIC